MEIINKIEGRGPGRDAFDALHQAVRDGKVKAFVLSVEYTDAYKKELLIEHQTRCDGTRGMFGTVPQTSALLVETMGQIFSNIGPAAPALCAGVVEALAFLVNRDGKGRVSVTTIGV